MNALWERILDAAAKCTNRGSVTVAEGKEVDRVTACVQIMSPM